MAASPYFSHLTSPDNSDIEAIISEAADLCALEQIAAINTAHLSASNLPAELESRFRDLKSFPSATRRPTLPPHFSIQYKENSPASSIQSEITSPKPEPKQGIVSSSTSSASPSAARRSPSPTRVVCCFGCSPKKAVRGRKVESGEEMFAGFGAEKMKEQRRRLQKVLREQEKASREVERMVEMFETAAAKLNAEALDELMGGDFMEKFK